MPTHSRKMCCLCLDNLGKKNTKCHWSFHFTFSSLITLGRINYILKKVLHLVEISLLSHDFVNFILSILEKLNMLSIAMKTCIIISTNLILYHQLNLGTHVCFFRYHFPNQRCESSKQSSEGFLTLFRT